MIFVCNRNSTSLSSRVLSTSSERNSVLGVRKALKSSTWRPWTPKACWIPTMGHSTLCRRGIAFVLWLFIVSTANSSCVMKVRHPQDFLVLDVTQSCILDFAFYINKNGWRSRPGWIIHWEGTPTAFGTCFCLCRISPRLTLPLSSALHYPYVLAFEPTFIEIRHVETGLMAQVIPGTAISCLFADTPPSADSAAPQHIPTPVQQYPSANSRNSFNPYAQPPHPHHGHPQGGPPPRYPNPNARRELHKRDEIILAMDDRVVELKLVPPALSLNVGLQPPIPPPHMNSSPNPNPTPTMYNNAPSYATLPRY